MRASPLNISEFKVIVRHMHVSRIPSFLLLFTLCGTLIPAGCARAGHEPAKAPPLTATITTDRGNIEIELLPDVAPKTVENFVLLAQRGYYDGLKFFRVVKDFMIQTGDPENDGKGGQSAWGKPFEDEIDKTSALYRDGYKRGSVAMANMGPNTNKSQFFIVQKDFPLHPGFTIFGKVTRGMEVVDAIANVPTQRGFDGGMSQPITMPVIQKVTIHGTLPAKPAAAADKK